MTYETVSGVQFTLDGQAVGWQRSRHRGKQHFQAKKTADWEAYICLRASEAMRGQPLFQGAMALSVEVVLLPPKSWSKKRQQAALAQRVMPTGRPDLDNYVKAICDGMNGVVWGDDSQVCRMTVTKSYGETPKVAVIAWEMGKAA